MNQLMRTNEKNMILLMQSFYTLNTRQSIYRRSVTYDVIIYPVAFFVLTSLTARRPMRSEAKNTTISYVNKR